MEERIPISALNQYAFCPRRCALVQIEGIWAENEHTILGGLLHEQVDKHGYETIRGAKVLRALPLYSECLGLIGQADVVELRDDEVIPVEYKKGRRRRFENDDIQLCAQALCLEEMFSTRIAKGFIYHAASRHRRELIIDEQLRRRTVDVIAAVRQMLSSGRVPAAEFKPRCDGCSLRRICMPEITDPVHAASLELGPI